MDNRFKELRYKDKYALDPEISINQMARLLDVSPATVSKLEHDENYDARVSIIKKYKKLFKHVTYDYLLGATNTQHKQYNPIEESLPFGNDFYNNLETLFKEHIKRRDSSGELKDYMTMDNLGLMMEAFLCTPNALLDLFEIIMNSLLYIRRCETGKTSHTKKEEDYFISGAKTTLAQESLSFITDQMYPHICRMLDDIIKEEDTLDEQIRLENLPEPF